MTVKNKRYIEFAKRVAEQSDYGKFRHGAVLVKGSSVRSISCNKHRHCSFGARFRKEGHGEATLHAELGAILGIERSTTQARINKEGEARISKPCPMCEAAMRHVGVRRVYYTNEHGKIERMRL